MNTLHLLLWGFAGIFAVALVSYLHAATAIGLMVLRVRRAGYDITNLTMRQINSLDSKLRSSRS